MYLEDLGWRLKDIEKIGSQGGIHRQTRWLK